MNKHEWTTALKSFVRAQHEAVPIPERDNLTDEKEWHSHIIGGDFINWRQRRLWDILEQRTVLSIGTFDPDLLTVSLPGLVAALAEVRSVLARLPGTAHLTVINGAVHSFFGRYGPQRGDGLPTVTPAAAERQIIGALGAFLQ